MRLQNISDPLKMFLLATQNGGAISNAFFIIHFMVSNESCLQIHSNSVKSFNNYDGKLETLGLVEAPCGVL